MTVTTPQTRASTSGSDGGAEPRRGQQPPRPDLVAGQPSAGRPARPGTPRRGAGPSRGSVVLWRLPSLYAHGLRDALLDAGHERVVSYEDDRALDAALDGEPASVVVVPDGAVSSVDLDALYARVAVVELVTDDGVGSFTAAVRRGAFGVLDPATELDHAVEVVAAAAAGLVLVPGRVDAALLDQHGAFTPPPVDDGERGWLRWLGSGGTVAALAEASAYSEREMYRLLRRLYTRLGASGRTEALLLAERWGLLDD